MVDIIRLNDIMLSVGSMDDVVDLRDSPKIVGTMDSEVI